METGIFRENGRYYLSFQYLPKRLPHREDKIKTLRRVIKPILSEAYEEYAIPVIYGPTGTGKTTTVRYLIERIREEAVNPRLHISMINCGVEQKPYNVMQRVSQEVLEMMMRGYGYEEIITMVYDALEMRDEYLLLILDEVDELLRNDKGRLLYIITRLEERIESVKRIFPLLIARRYESIIDLPPHIRNKISGPVIYFEPYSREQMKDIILDRVELAINPDKISDNSIDIISFISANIEGGDARSALTLLKNSGEIAESLKASRIIAEHVRKAFEQRGGLIIARYLKSLDSKSFKLLKCIAEILSEDLDKYIINTEVMKRVQFLMSARYGICMSDLDINEYLERLRESRLLHKDNNNYIFISLPIESILRS